jgi:dipeptidase E
LAGSIVAMGGGGFSMEPDNPALDRYVLARARREHPSVCFLPTASGDAGDYIVRFYAAFTALPCSPTHLSLFRLPTADLASMILAQDVLYVGGGNTRSMLAVWREWGLVDLLRRALEEGVVLAGVSAGANCWFEQAVTDAVPGRMSLVAGLGLVGGSCCPHYANQPLRRPGYHRLMRAGEIGPGYGIDDGAALHLVDGALREVVCSREEAYAYRVEVVAGDIVEHRLPRTVLDH